MDTGRFDAWTRRRFGLGVSGLAAGLLAAASGSEALAKKKKKKCPKPEPCPQVDTCPQDYCCSCNEVSRCGYLQASTQDEAGTECAQFCGTPGTASFGRGQPGQRSTRCDSNNRLVSVRCPVV